MRQWTNHDDNGLSPGRRGAIIWTNAGILLIGPLGTNFSEILIEIDIFSLKNPFENIVSKMAAICPCLSVLSNPTNRLTTVSVMFFLK